MRRDLPKRMTKNRKAKVIYGRGEAWFYVSRSGLEVYYASVPKCCADSVVRITVSQLKHALRIIQADREGTKG